MKSNGEHAFFHWTNPARIDTDGWLLSVSNRHCFGIISDTCGGGACDEPDPSKDRDYLCDRRVHDLVVDHATTRPICRAWATDYGGRSARIVCSNQVDCRGNQSTYAASRLCCARDERLGRQSWRHHGHWEQSYYGARCPSYAGLDDSRVPWRLGARVRHYDAGDTKLGPWIFVTRAAIIRTVINLAQQGSSIIRKPFEWYLQMFLFLTQKVSRHQEFNADALAAKIVGPEAMSSGLKNVHANAVAFDSYWQNEYIPVLSSGFRAPLSQGFQAYCSGEKLQHALGELIDEELKTGKADIYDSHPALKDRLAAIQSIVGPALPALDPPFIENLRNLDELEGKMIGHLAKQAKVANPESISWESVAEKVWLPHWKQTCERFGRQTEDLSLMRATEILGSAEGIPNLLAPAILKQVQANHEQAEIAFNLIPTALVLALHREGWSISTPLGAPVVAQLHGRTLEPFTLFGKLQKKQISISGLLEEFQGAGIEDLMLCGRA